MDAMRGKLCNLKKGSYIVIIDIPTVHHDGNHFGPWILKTKEEAIQQLTRATGEKEHRVHSEYHEKCGVYEIVTDQQIRMTSVDLRSLFVLQCCGEHKNIVPQQLVDPTTGQTLAVQQGAFDGDNDNHCCCCLVCVGPTLSGHFHDEIAITSCLEDIWSRSLQHLPCEHRAVLAVSLMTHNKALERLAEQLLEDPSTSFAVNHMIEQRFLSFEK